MRPKLASSGFRNFGFAVTRLYPDVSGGVAPCNAPPDPPVVCYKQLKDYIDGLVGMHRGRKRSS